MTPIEKARNIGPKVGSELREIGISTVEELKKMGYEKAFLKLIAVFPERINANCIAALYGAEHNLDWKDAPLEIKKKVSSLRKK